MQRFSNTPQGTKMSDYHIRPPNPGCSPREPMFPWKTTIELALSALRADSTRGSINPDDAGLQRARVPLNSALPYLHDDRRPRRRRIRHDLAVSYPFGIYVRLKSARKNSRRFRAGVFTSPFSPPLFRVSPSFSLAILSLHFLQLSYGFTVQRLPDEVGSRRWHPCP